MIVLHWNVYVGQSPRRALPRLRSLTHAFAPHIVSLNEASRLQGVLDVEGYQTLQLPSVGDNDEPASSAVLVRDDVELLAHKAVRMRRRWSLRKPHAPRVYHRLRVRLPNGEIWRVVVAHYPPGGPDGKNRVAWLESSTRLGAWLAATRLPSLIVGDLNGSIRAVRLRHGRPLVAGHRIDLAVFRRARLVAEPLVLRKGGSDHAPVVFRFAKR